MKRILGVVLGGALLGVVGCDSNDRDDRYDDDYRGTVVSRDREYDRRDWEQRDRWDDDRWDRERDWDRREWERRQRDRDGERDWDDRDDGVRSDPRYRDVPWGQPERR
jgi:hypothetical protein